jgi:hypothetical protein
MKNKVLFLVIYTWNKRRADYAQRWGGKQKIEFKIIKMVFTDLIIKGMCLPNTWK